MTTTNITCELCRLRSRYNHRWQRRFVAALWILMAVVGVWVVWGNR